MGIDAESFNTKLYDLLRVRGYKPVPLNFKNQRVQASQNADVIEFTFMKDDEDYGKVWVSLDDAQKLIVYYDNEQQESPDVQTPGLDYDDTWTGFLKLLKNWAQRRQLSFELSNKDRLGDDMKQREHYKMKEKLGEGYHAMGKKASYNDAIPNVKIVLQHNRALEEGEQRYRNVAKIYLENVDGERFLAPTTRPGVARVYARHIAEGGVPNDDRWNHIKGLCEEYNKMAGFIRATKNGQFNESVQALVTEGINHYTKLRENLSKMTGHRGYTLYFESWSPALMEDEGSSDISEMFMSSSLDPRIESVMPILSRLHKNVSEAKEISELTNWADELISETIDMDEEFKNWKFELEPGDHTKVISGDHAGLRGTVVKKHDGGETYSIKDKNGKITRHHISTLDEPVGLEEADGESLTSNNPVGIPEGEELEENLGPEQKRVGQLGPTEKVGKNEKNLRGKLVGACESVEHDELTRMLDILRFKN